MTKWETLEGGFTDIADMVELAAEEEENEELLDELEADLDKLSSELDQFEFITNLSEPSDGMDAILTIHAGAGGTESCDWASMLLRMYRMWADRKGFSFDVADMLAGDEAGVKSVTVMVKGEYAFGLLKGEVGVHRLVRISPFDSSKRRHTSFASVDVIPEAGTDIDIQIADADIRIDTYRAGGAGGQHVNKTSSAVRITHLETGLVVQCQNERSQHKNKDLAMKVLKSRLYDLEMKKQQAERNSREKDKKEIAWGSQIRSYVFHPYNMVKDLRTDEQTSNTTAVMDGEIDMFLESFLKWLQEQKR